MRIDGLPNQPKVTQTNQRGDAARAKKAGAGRGSDSVEISQSAQDVSDLTEAAKTVPDGLNPRIGEIKAKVQSGHYNQRQVIEEVAGSVMESSGMRQVVGEIAEVRSAQRSLADVPDTRADVVRDAQQKVASKFYDEPEVRQGTAQNFLDEMM